jgi:hypothetical protein
VLLRLKTWKCVYSKPKSGFFDKNNQFSMNVMKTICGDLKEADSHTVNMAQKTVERTIS